MKTARPLAFAFLGSALLFACASGDGGTGGGGSGGTGSGPSTSAPATSTGAGNTVAATTGANTSTGTGGTCAPMCSVDNDCGHTCPAVPSGESNCCDTMTHMCYVNNFSTCPANTTTTGVGGQSQY